MVTPNRELVNINFLFVFSLPSNLQVHNNMATNMDINTSRGQFINSSANNSRESSIYSSVLLITYAKRVKALNNSPF